MTGLIIAPVLIPLTTAVFTTFTYRHPKFQSTLSFMGIVSLLIIALLLLIQVMDGNPLTLVFGAWAVPFGVQFRIDHTSALLVLVTALIGSASLLFLYSDTDSKPRHGLLLPLLHGLIAAICGAFCTGDLFNLYVWFEVLLICALGLFVLGERIDQYDAAFKYLILNLFGTLLLLIGVGTVYAMTGHLNFNALTQALTTMAPFHTVILLTILTLAFLIKCGAFPFFQWLPASYHTLPAPVLALFAGLLTKVGIYAVFRTMGGVFASATPILSEILGWIACATMVFGVLGAAYHWDMRRILAFHIISQVGYILLAIALGNEAGYTATLFYTVHHVFVKSNLFLIAAIIYRLTGGYDLRSIGGLYVSFPWVAILFLIPALSLVGIPPLSGFWAKLLILKQTIAMERNVWTITALFVSLLTMYSMVKIWMEAFWKPHPVAEWKPNTSRLTPAWIATGMLTLITLSISLNPEFVIAYAQQAVTTLRGY